MYISAPFFRFLLLIAAGLLVLAATESYYAILEIPEGTDDVTVIKAAYKKLALKYHPDKSKENKIVNEEKLMKINEAYEHLVDHDKRRRYRYDQERKNAFKRVLEKASPKFKKIFQDTTRIWNDIPIDARASLTADLGMYAKSDMARQDVSLLFTEGGLFNGAVRGVLVAVTVTAFFASIGVVTSLIATFKLGVEVVRTVCGIVVLPFKLIFGKTN